MPVQILTAGGGNVLGGEGYCPRGSCQRRMSYALSSRLRDVPTLTPHSLARRMGRKGTEVSKPTSGRAEFFF